MEDNRDSVIKRLFELESLGIKTGLPMDLDSLRRIPLWELEYRALRGDMEAERRRVINDKLVTASVLTRATLEALASDSGTISAEAAECLELSCEQECIFNRGIQALKDYLAFTV